MASDLADARDMLSVNVDEAKAAKLGMTQAGIGQDVARAVRGQLIGTLAQGDTTLNVYLRSGQPVQSIGELRDLKLPVTQRMTANAKTDAADKVQKRSDKLSAQSKRDATKAYNDQVAELRKSRRDAVKAQQNLTTQLNRSRSQLAKLQRQLGALQQSLPQVCATNPTDPRCTPLPASVYQLSQQVAGAASQVAALSSALTQAKSGSVRWTSSWMPWPSSGRSRWTPRRSSSRSPTTARPPATRPRTRSRCRRSPR